MNKTALGSAYIRGVQGSGLAIIVAGTVYTASHPPSWIWLALTALTAITGAYAVRIPGVVVRLSLSEPIVFLSTLLFGPFPGTLTAAVDALVMTLRLPQRLRTPHRILFNVGAIAVSVLPSSLLYFRIAGLDTTHPLYGSLDTFVGPLYVFAISVFVLNSGLVAAAVSVERGVSAFTVWRTQFLWLSASYLASAAIAAILVVFTNAVDFALAVVLLPLVAVTFLAVRTTLGRLDDTNKHLSEVNSLYLSTIETLAMAIDAKDQVTHGHIRRVQRFAVGLAHALGISDDKQIRAIEAAALLHDMGKLAIPEFILNKPGRLTAHEFAVMQTHAAIGADLLSSIKFPYPVVPIVRHHHESWDGSGYPDGLRGAAIPLGARILSVVDCYDALTSDRPYRPALPVSDALEILVQRRGKMYDPLVVDTFVREYALLAQHVDLSHLPEPVLSPRPEPPAAEPATSTHVDTAPVESLRVLALTSSLPTTPTAKTIADAILDSLRDVVRFDSAAIFVLDDDGSTIRASHAVGSAADLLQGLRFHVPERLSGWVAAHQASVWNSDASLDIPALSTRGLVVGSAIPLRSGDVLLGVLSMYGRIDQEVSVAERRALETLLPALGDSLAAAAQRPEHLIDCADPTIRQSTLETLDSLLAHPREGANSPPALLYVSLSNVSLDPEDDARTGGIVDALIMAVSLRSNDSRCAIRLGSLDYFLCALDGAEVATVEAEVRDAARDRRFCSLVIHVTAIRNSLELQHVAQRVFDAPKRRSDRRRAERIH